MSYEMSIGEIQGHRSWPDIDTTRLLCGQAIHNHISCIRSVEWAWLDLERNIQLINMRLDMLEMAGEVGVKWTGTLLNVYAGGKDTERVEDGPDSADMGEEMGFAWPRKVLGHHTTQPSIATVEEGFRRKDQKKSKKLFRGRTARVQEGEMNSIWDVRPETYGREETGGTGLWASSTQRKLLTQYPEIWWWRHYGGWEYQKRKWRWLRARTRRQQ